MNSKPKKIKKIRTLKNYKERADYLTFIDPMRGEMYQAIADFFGHDEIPPKSKSSNGFRII